MKNKDLAELGREFASLNFWYSIIALCEGGISYNANKDEIQKIIKICRKNAGIHLQNYDEAFKAMGEVNHE